MVTSHDWVVGDEVLESGGPWAGPKIGRVTRVLKRFIELADGSKWSHYGRPYPSEEGARRFLTYPVTDADRDRVRRCELVALLREVRERDDPKRSEYKSHQEWETVSLAMLEKIAALLS